MPPRLPFAGLALCATLTALCPANASPVTTGPATTGPGTTGPGTTGPGTTQASLHAQLREQLRALTAQRDLPGFDAFHRKLTQLRPTLGQAAYLDLVCSECGDLNSYDFHDDSRFAKAQQFALDGLNEPDLPLTAELRLLRFLRTDLPVPSATAPATGPTSQPAIPANILHAQRWLRTWRRFDDAYDPNWKPLLVHLNVPMPPGAPLGIAGMDPAAIPDPAVRRQYLDAIARNQANARRNLEQHELATYGLRFHEAAEAYVIWAYSQPPAYVDDLATRLAQSIQDPPTRDRILKAVRANLQSNPANPR